MTTDQLASPQLSETDTDSVEPHDKTTAGQKRASAESTEATSTPTDSKKRKLQLSISVRGLTISLMVTALVAAVGALACMYVAAQHKLDEQARQAANTTRAEKIALDYAVNAAAMNYADLDTWKTKLVAGTSPELKQKLSKAAESMQQVLVPLQWISTASPLAATVVSNTGGSYVVEAFVSVSTKTVQAPDALRSTATYSVTIDSKDWQISDIGGLSTITKQK